MRSVRQRIGSRNSCSGYCGRPIVKKYGAMTGMKPSSKQFLIDNYRSSLAKHGAGARVGQQSAEGQRFRFEKLAEVGDLTGATVLDVGCNLGDLFPFLAQRFDRLRYTGIDIVPELIERARSAHPETAFECRDLLLDPYGERFDYVFISGTFNNNIPDSGEFLREMTAAAFEACRRALAFNFISTHVNFRDAEIAYHDPVAVLAHCVEHLSPKVILQHHYERCDVAVFVYR